MSAQRFVVGTPVRIRQAYPPGHVRAPWYLRGCEGSICHVVGEFRNPEELAYGRYDGPRLTLYRVRIAQNDIWSDYKGAPQDTLEVEIYENWLEEVTEEASA